MTNIQQTISPIDGSVVAERALATEAEITAAFAAARVAQRDWKHVPLAERTAIVMRGVANMSAQRDLLGEELTRQMGRPIRYTPKEIDRMAERAEYMASVAPEVLADITLDPIEGFDRFLRREPVGVVFAIVPWNYPYLVQVNSIVPALLAGNAVVLKPSPHTPLCGERMAEAFHAAGLPPALFQVLHLSIEGTQFALKSPEINYVSFTGSVGVGRAVQQAVSDRFIGVGLELGGKDPAYVRPDANLEHAIENLVDGAMFNSGQSCCSIERIYVHADLYDAFVEGVAALTRTYLLDSPLNPETTLGPLVRTSSAEFVRGQIAEAVRQGACALVDESLFPLSQPGTPYLAPQILVNVNHSMRVMTEESFGPVVGIMRVESDEEAIRLMNDSDFGLTAAVWTSDPEAAVAIGDRIETGTWFMNRCDFLAPGLAWTGVKNSGRGCSLSRLGYDALTRPKSFHLRTKV
jgi:acyl-CoA reductase-like NAD-dependent aldehyde dehydrogenase